MLPRRSKNLTNIVAMLRIFFRPTTAKEGRVSPPKNIANKFIRQYAFPPKSGKVFRKVKRRLDKHVPIDRTFSPFSADDMAAVIRGSKNSTATGPDGLAPWHLK